MNFSNMNPAERMKASGLIGLIVVILFFVVHTMMGVVAPKKAAAPEAGAQTPAGAQATPTASATPAAVAGAPGAAEAFPTGKITGDRRKGADSLALDIHDPFVPLQDGARPGADTNDDVKRTPRVFAQNDAKSKPIGNALDMNARAASSSPMMSQLPNLGPATFGPGPANAPAAAPAPPADPEIRVVGVVHGDPSVATLQVSGRMIIARPGDALAKGWRLLSVNSEGVQVRHMGEIMPLRVGGVLNESRRDEVKK